MTEAACEAWAQTEWGRLMLPCLWCELYAVVFADAPELGSLIDPEVGAHRYVDRAFHRDPPEFRAWLVRRWGKWNSDYLCRLERGEAPTEEDRLFRAMAAHRGLALE